MLVQSCGWKFSGIEISVFCFSYEYERVNFLLFPGSLTLPVWYVYIIMCTPNSWQVAAVDLIFPGMGELVGGSLREERPQVLHDKLQR